MNKKHILVGEFFSTQCRAVFVTMEREEEAGLLDHPNLFMQLLPPLFSVPRPKLLRLSFHKALLIGSQLSRARSGQVGPRGD